MPNTLDMERMAFELEASRQYRVLRSLKPRRMMTARDGSETRVGLFLDVETTGLDPMVHEVIELAMVPFTFGRDGRIFEVGTPFDQFQQPVRPLELATTRLTGITDETVSGRSIDLDDVERMVATASIIIAHNARFDRRFCEALSPVFQHRPWACSMTQIDWSAEGFESRKLEFLAMKSGYFYEAHNAVFDCFAGIELLAHPLPSGLLPLGVLLTEASRVGSRILLRNAPFELNATLKARGYRWSPGSLGCPSGWYLECAGCPPTGELDVLDGQRGPSGAVQITRLTALERFSNRTGAIC